MNKLDHRIPTEFVGRYTAEGNASINAGSVRNLIAKRTVMSFILKRDQNHGSLHRRKREKVKEVTERGRKEMTEKEAEVKVWRGEEKNQRTEDLSLHIRLEQGLIESQRVTDSLKIVKTRKNEMKGN